MSRPPRWEIIDETNLGFYHCRSKCVRGEFLCGKDNKPGKDFSHRMDWIWERLVKLAGLFAIDVTFVAVLGNHLHLLLRNRPDIVKQWTEEEIMRRAVLIFPYRFKAFGGYSGGPTTRQLRDLVADKEQVDEMRARLSSISWLMRQLNQKIATQANAQDEVTGHFWEGRFKATPVLDTLGLLVCAMYVDLNVVRAGVADTPEDSFHTSAAARIRGMKARQQDDSTAVKCDGWLSRLSLLSDEQPGYPPAGQLDGLRASDNGVLEMTSPDYLQLLDFAGRCVPGVITMRKVAVQVTCPACRRNRSGEPMRRYSLKRAGKSRTAERDLRGAVLRCNDRLFQDTCYGHTAQSSQPRLVRRS